MLEGLATGLALDVGIDCRGSPVTEPRIETLSDGAGEKAEPTLVVGELECEGGVGRVLGDVAGLCGRSAVLSGATTGSVLGTMPEWDFRDWWWRFMMARWIVGGCTMFWGVWVGPRSGLPVLA